MPLKEACSSAEPSFNGCGTLSGLSKTRRKSRSLRGRCRTTAVYILSPRSPGWAVPHWNQEARGTILGLSRGTGKAHIARAALESIALQTCDLLASMNDDSGTDLTELRVDGGATANDLLMQIQADVLQLPVVRSKTTETTALGAAYFAGLAVGFWGSADDLKRHWKEVTIRAWITSGNAAAMRSKWRGCWTVDQLGGIKMGELLRPNGGS